MSARRNQARRLEAKRAKVPGYKQQKALGIKLTQRGKLGTLSAREMFEVRRAERLKTTIDEPLAGATPAAQLPARRSVELADVAKLVNGLELNIGGRKITAKDFVKGDPASE